MMMMNNREEACTLARILNSVIKTKKKFIVLRKGKIFEIEEVNPKIEKLKKSDLFPKRVKGKTKKRKQIIKQNQKSRKELYQKIVDDYFAGGTTYQKLEEKYGVSSRMIFNICSEYKKNGFKFEKEKFSGRHLKGWLDNRANIEIVLRERSKGRTKADIMAEFGLNETRYQYASSRISMGLFLDIEEYREMIEKYGYGK